MSTNILRKRFSVKDRNQNQTLGKMVTIKVDFYWHVLHTYFDFIHGLRYKAFQTLAKRVSRSVWSPPQLTVSPKTYQKIIPSNLLSKYSCSPNVIIYIGTNFHFKSVDNSKSYNILHIYSIHPTTEKKIHTLTTLIFL